MPKTKISVFVRTILYSLALIIPFGVIGYSIDQANGSGPKFTIIAVVISYPITQLFLRSKMRSFAQQKIEQAAILPKKKQTTK